jgi:hypothetical protein
VRKAGLEAELSPCNLIKYLPGDNDCEIERVFTPVESQVISPQSSTSVVGTHDAFAL